MLAQSDFCVTGQTRSQIEQHVGAEDGNGINDGVVIFANQGVLCVEPDARKCDDALIVLLPLVVRIPDKQSLALADTVIYPAKPVAEFIKRQIRAGKEIIKPATTVIG